MRIFFAGPLTNLKDYRKTEAFYTRIANVAKQRGFTYFWAFLNGTDPNKERKISARDVYKRDIGQLAKSDIMVAYIGEPSTGAGVEIEYANQHHIPVILLYEKGNWTSRMARGCPAVKKEIVFTDVADAVRQFDAFLKTIKT